MVQKIGCIADRDDSLGPVVLRFGQGCCLSGREREVLLLAAQGFADKQISGELGLAYTTVRSYWQRICLKVSASNRQIVISKLLAAIAGQSSEPGSISHAGNAVAVPTAGDEQSKRAPDGSRRRRPGQTLKDGASDRRPTKSWP